MTPPLSKIRAGVIGAGFIGPVHIEALRRLGVQVVAVCGSDVSAAAAAERFGVPRAIGGHDAAALIASPDVDVVHIASPNRLHCAQALAAVEAGKHCVCEKPMAMDTRETAALVRAASRGGRVFAVNYNVRFYPAVLQLRAMVARNDFGKIFHVGGSYLQDWLLHDDDYNWRLLSSEGGALRAVSDIGSHWLDTAAFILGSPVSAVFADLATVHPRRRRPVGEVKTFAQPGAATQWESYDVDTEDVGHLLLRFAGGARGALAVSQVAAGRKNCIRLEIYGARGAAWWCSEDPDVLHLGRRDEPNGTAFRACAGFRDAGGFTDYPGGHVEGFPDTFKMLYRAVYADVARGAPGEAPLYATAADGHQEACIGEAVLESHRSGRWASVAPARLTPTEP